MWKNQIISSILLSYMVYPLHSHNMQASNTEQTFGERIANFPKPTFGKISRSMIGGPLISHQPLILSLGYGPIQETKPPGLPMNFQNHKPTQQFRGEFMIIQRTPHDSPPFHRQFLRSSKAFSRPTFFQNHDSGDRFRNWYPPSFPKVPAGSESFPKIPVRYIVSEPQDFLYIQGPLESRNLVSSADSPRIEFLKSDSYTLPPEVTVYHPADYAKNYFIDKSTMDSKDSEDNDQELLIGEEKKADAEDNLEIMVDGNTGMILRDQYFQTNRKPLMFDNSNGREPKNIYEIISAEKLVPENLDIMVEKKMNLSWEPLLESTTETTAEATDVVEVEATDGEKAVTESSFKDEEINGSKTIGECEEENDDEENADLRVEKLAERKSFKKNGNKMKSRLDVVLIGHKICRK